MIASAFHLARLALAWMSVYLALCIVASHTLLRDHEVGGWGALLGFAVFALVLLAGFSHVRRMRLIAGGVNAASLSNRQRQRRRQRARQPAAAPLRDLLAALDPAMFRQVHRSTVVNLRAVAAVTRDDSGRGPYACAIAQKH